MDLSPYRSPKRRRIDRSSLDIPDHAHPFPLEEPPHPSPEQDEGLAMRRANVDRKFRSVMDRICDKYGRDFEGIGDEIDMETGKIVVNNGHLKGLKRPRKNTKLESRRIPRVKRNVSNSAKQSPTRRNRAREDNMGAPVESVPPAQPQEMPAMNPFGPLNGHPYLSNLFLPNHGTPMYPFGPGAQQAQMPMLNPTAQPWAMNPFASWPVPGGYFAPMFYPQGMAGYPPEHLTNGLAPPQYPFFGPMPMPMPPMHPAHEHASPGRSPKKEFEKAESPKTRKPRKTKAQNLPDDKEEDVSVSDSQAESGEDSNASEDQNFDQADLDEIFDIHRPVRRQAGKTGSHYSLNRKRGLSIPKKKRRRRLPIGTILDIAKSTPGVRPAEKQAGPDLENGFGEGFDVHEWVDEADPIDRRRSGRTRRPVEYMGKMSWTEAYEELALRKKPTKKALPEAEKKADTGSSARVLGTRNAQTPAARVIPDSQDTMTPPLSSAPRQSQSSTTTNHRDPGDAAAASNSIGRQASNPSVSRKHASNAQSTEEARDGRRASTSAGFTSEGKVQVSRRNVMTRPSTKLYTKESAYELSDEEAPAPRNRITRKTKSRDTLEASRAPEDPPRVKSLEQMRDKTSATEPGMPGKAASPQTTPPPRAPLQPADGKRQDIGHHSGMTVATGIAMSPAGEAARPPNTRADGDGIFARPIDPSQPSDLRGSSPTRRNMPGQVGDTQSQGHGDSERATTDFEEDMSLLDAEDDSSGDRAMAIEHPQGSVEDALPASDDTMNDFGTGFFDMLHDDRMFEPDEQKLLDEQLDFEAFTDFGGDHAASHEQANHPDMDAFLHELEQADTLVDDQGASTNTQLESRKEMDSGVTGDIPSAEKSHEPDLKDKQQPAQESGEAVNSVDQAFEPCAIPPQDDSPAIPGIEETTEQPQSAEKPKETTSTTNKIVPSVAEATSPAVPPANATEANTGTAQQLSGMSLPSPAPSGSPPPHEMPKEVPGEMPEAPPKPSPKNESRSSPEASSNPGQRSQSSPVRPAVDTLPRASSTSSPTLLRSQPAQRLNSSPERQVPQTPVQKGRLISLRHSTPSQRSSSPRRSVISLLNSASSKRTYKKSSSRSSSKIKIEDLDDELGRGTPSRFETPRLRGSTPLRSVPSKKLWKSSALTTEVQRTPVKRSSAAAVETAEGVEDMVRSPGGTLRRCGDGDFRCGRDWCFECL